MLDLVGTPNCWFSHALAHFIFQKQAAGKFSLPPAPAWLRKVCGKQLTVILMRPKGVQSVLRGMLDAPGEGQGNVNTCTLLLNTDYKMEQSFY